MRSQLACVVAGSYSYAQSAGSWEASLEEMANTRQPATPDNGAGLGKSRQRIDEPYCETDHRAAVVQTDARTAAFGKRAPVMSNSVCPRSRDDRNINPEDNNHLY